MKDDLKHLLIRGATWLGVGLKAAIGNRSAGRFGILMYHRVAEPIAGLAPPTINVSPNRFRLQIGELLERGYVFWPLKRLVDYHHRGWQVPPYVTSLTFDDGFAGVYEFAWPVLSDLQIPATLFVSTAYLDSQQPLPFDDWGRQCQAVCDDKSTNGVAYRSLTRKQCQEMHASGLIEIGSHTHSHQDFRQRPDDLYHDVGISLELIRELVGNSSTCFAFPYGTPRLGFATEELIDAVRRAGVICALNTSSELNPSTRDPFHWGRFNVFEWDGGVLLDAKLSGWYSWAPRVRRWLPGSFSRAQDCCVTDSNQKQHPSTVQEAQSTSTECSATVARLQPDSGAHHPDRISVIVPTFNRANWIVEALQSLAEQETNGEFEFEIVVVDNGSRDETRDRIQEYVPRCPVRLVYLCQLEPGDAPTRNFGLQHATGNWLAFFDDDQLAAPNWLAELYRASRRLDARIVGGAVHLHLTEEKLQELGPLCRKALRELRLFDSDHPYIGNQLPGTGNALVHRSVFQRIGAFDARMRSGGSDSDFFMRARRAGNGMWYTPKAVIRHRIPAQRLTPEYFRWDALAGGAGHAAHFDYQRGGVVWMILICLLRTFHALLFTAPRIAWAWVLGNQGELLGRKTLWWRAEGYLRRTLQVLFPRLCRQQSFFEWLDFRNGRNVGDKQEPRQS